MKMTLWGGKSGASYLQLIKAQREVQDLCKLLGQRLLPLQVLSGVVVRLAGQSSQEAVQRRLCEREKAKGGGGGCRRGGTLTLTRPCRMTDEAELLSRSAETPVKCPKCFGHDFYPTFINR